MDKQTEKNERPCITCKLDCPGLCDEWAVWNEIESESDND